MLQSILKKLGAAAVTPACHLTIRHSDLDARAEELASFLEAEDYEDQFTLLAEGEEPQWALFSVTVEGP